MTGASLQLGPGKKSWRHHVVTTRLAHINFFKYCFNLHTAGTELWAVVLTHQKALLKRIFTSKKHTIREIPRVLLVVTYQRFVSVSVWEHEFVSFVQCGMFWLTDYEKRISPTGADYIFCWRHCMVWPWLEYSLKWCEQCCCPWNPKCVCWVQYSF